MSSRRSHLHDDQIINYLINGEDSEDGMDFGDDDVIDPNFEAFENLMSDDDADTADIEIMNLNELEDSETIPQPTVPDQQATTSDSSSRKKKGNALETKESYSKRPAN